MPTSTFTDLSNARFDDQRQIMEQIEKDGVCPFCWNHLQEYHLEPIIKQGQYWIITNNHWPYKNTQHHFLFIYRDHIESLTGVNPTGAQELFELTEWLIKEYKIPGGGLFLRFGNTAYSAGSVRHLHGQLVVPNINDPDFEPVRVKIGTKG